MNKIRTMLKPLLLIGLSLALSACGGSNSASCFAVLNCDDRENWEETPNELADTYPYKTSSAHSAVLKNCAITDEQFCPLQTLPLLGMEYNDPGIAQIMDRVLVSHDWMGERFEELLYELPEGMLPLFKGITAIVIDADIRPAYYSSGTGAIYLDPAFLWLSVEEKRTVSTEEDYRAGFDDPLAFRYLSRYLLDGQDAFSWGSLEDNSTRELADIVLLTASLLLHELAHANDFIPPDTYDTIQPAHSVLEASSVNENVWLSSQLTDSSGLESMVMLSLGGVMYQGRTPTAEDLDITATEAGTHFRPDGAADHYAYSSQWEDFAMLFETAMMKYFFNADYELAFTSVPQDAWQCADYLVGWGVRNRLGDDQVKERARFTATTLLPASDFNNFFDTLDPSTEISGDWCDTSPASTISTKPSQPSRVDPTNRLRPYL